MNLDSAESMLQSQIPAKGSINESTKMALEEKDQMQLMKMKHKNCDHKKLNFKKLKYHLQEKKY